MSFDLYTDQISEKIKQDEEYIFSYVDNLADFPLLNWIWCEYYQSPQISADQANDIVHELILLCSLHQSDKRLVNTVSRLLPFFSFCYKKNLTIETSSD